MMAPLRLAVIGAPVHHSLSPLLWERLLALGGRAGKMEAVEVTPAALAGFLDEVRGGRFDALSVTLPHKERLLDLVDEVEPAAATLGAANFVARREDGRLVAANTDVDGVHLALVHAPLLGRSGAGQAQRAVVLGAGGAARAAAVALLEEGLLEVVVANRTLARAEQLVADLDDERLGAATLDEAGLRTPVAHADLIINATSVGLSAPDDDPLPAGVVLSSRHVVMDMVYRPRATALLRRAAAQCAAPIDGLWMLAGQALAAYERLTHHNAHHLLDALHDHLARALDHDLAADRDLDFLAARAAIDRVDGEIVRLLGERFAAAAVIGRVKARLDEPVVRPAREQGLRQRLRERGADHGLPDGLVDQVYHPVLGASRAVQEALREPPSPSTIADEPPLMAPPSDDEEPA